MCFPLSPSGMVPGGVLEYHTNSLMSMMSAQRPENVEERCGGWRDGLDGSGVRDDRWGLHVMVSWLVLMCCTSFGSNRMS